MSDEVGGWMGRRRFLAAGSALSLGILGRWACGPSDSSSGVAEGRYGDGHPGPGSGDSAGADGAGRGDRGAEANGEAAGPHANGLPPRVVGLRSLGGAFRFDPVGLFVEPGDEVRWLNLGDFHTVTAFHPDNASLIPSPVPLRMPEDAASYHSGMLGLTAGTQFTHRFDVEGVYDYFCQPHYSFGMVGRIIVGEAVDGPALNRLEDDLIEAARANMPSVESIVGPDGVLFEWAARINGVLYLMVNDGDAAAAAEAVAGGATADAALRDRLSDEEWTTLEEALSEMLGEIDGTADYEALVRRADAVKTVLL